MPIVSAAVGSYGAFLADGSEYRGNYNISKEELKAFHKGRIELLWNAGSDILAVETIPSLDEALIIAEIVKELNAKCWISFSCKNNTDISEGTKIKDCAKALSFYDCVEAIGINCTAPEFVPSLIKEAKAGGTKPVVVYPNSGEIYDAVTKTWHGRGDGRTYGSMASEWIDCGATIIGGCCRTTPENIKEVRQVVDKKLNK